MCCPTQPLPLQAAGRDNLETVPGQLRRSLSFWRTPSCVTQPQGPAFKKAFWDAEVTKMIKVYGAPIDEAGRARKIVDYLTQVS